ncbi:MAG TPA: hypothetical protein VEI02_03520, partial [Planctomycetota bacterium]|nr:hypothetical protein [Planctomycetota bacterium]
FDGDGDPDLDLHGIGFQHETTWLRNNARRTPGCAGAGGAIPRAVIGTATLGNAGFFIGLENAAPFAAAFLGVSLNVASSAACTTALDLGALVAPTPTFGWGTTNAAGALTITVPLPSSPVWSGTSAVIQWGVIDGAGASLIAGLSMALSDARVVLMGP